MGCTPSFCDIHDYRVAPGGGWCRAVDDAYNRSRGNSGQSEDLSAVVQQLADVVERLSRATSLPRQRPDNPPTARRTVRKGGVPT